MIDDREIRLNLLVAYPYLKPDVVAFIRDNADRIRLLVDSGAFTAWKAGKAIEVDQFCDFIESLPVRPWRFFALDVIGDPAGTRRNHEAMLARGLRPVPIFTRGEALDEIERLYETSDVVGIGGLVGTSGNRGFVNGVMSRVAGRRVHLLGFTDPDYLKAYRPYMADSNSWEAGGRFASVRLYMGAGRFRLIGKADFVKRPEPAIADAICRLGIDPGRLRYAAEWTGTWSTSRTLAARSFVAFSLDAHRHLGTLLFAASSPIDGAQHLVAAFDALRSLEGSPWAQRL